MKRVISIVVMMLLAIGIFAVPVHGSADKPIWSVGEKWAMGMENNAPTQTQIEDMENNLKQVLNLSELSIDISGSGGIWVTFEVTSVSDSEYTLRYSMAMRNNADEDFQFGAMMPEPGTYTSETFGDAPKTLKEMSAHFSMRFYTLGSGEITIDRESMGVKNMTLALEEKLEINFNGKNLPSVDEYGVFGYLQLGDEYKYGYGYSSSHTLSYEDTDIKVSQTLNLNLNIDYTPPAVFIDFPLTEGKVWDVKANETVTGAYSGTIDASGLPPMIESAITLGTGQSFPIKIEKINTYTPDFNNGSIRYSGPANMSLSCPGTMEIKDEDGNPITAYKIQPLPDCEMCYTPEIYLLYSPDKGFIAGIYTPSPANNLMPMPSGMENSTMYANFGAIASSLNTSGNYDTLGYMDYGKASNEISKTEQEMKGVVSGNFFSSPLFFVLLGSVIAAAVVISLIALRKRKNPAVMESAPPEESYNNPGERTEEEPPLF